MAWSILFVAGLLEIAWAIGLKYTEGFSKLIPSILTLAAMAPSVRTDGTSLLNPSVYLRPIAQETSSRPATNKMLQAMTTLHSRQGRPRD